MPTWDFNRGNDRGYQGSYNRSNPTISRDGRGGGGRASSFAPKKSLRNFGEPKKSLANFGEPAARTNPGFFAALSNRFQNALQAPLSPVANQSAPVSSPVVPTGRTTTAAATTSPILPTGEVGAGPVGLMDTGAGVPGPVVPPDPESDPTYQAQIAELAKAMADMQAQNNLARSQYDSNYNEGLRTLGWNTQQNAFDKDNSRGLYGQSYMGTNNDFGARGLRNSGLFAQSLSDLDSSFMDRKSDLDRQRQDYFDSQNLALSNFSSQNEIAREAARREAIARLAAQIGGF